MCYFLFWMEIDTHATENGQNIGPVRPSARLFRQQPVKRAPTRRNDDNGNGGARSPSSIQISCIHVATCICKLMTSESESKQTTNDKQHVHHVGSSRTGPGQKKSHEGTGGSATTKSTFLPAVVRMKSARQLLVIMGMSSKCS